MGVTGHHCSSAISCYHSRRQLQLISSSLNTHAILISLVRSLFEVSRAVCVPGPVIRLQFSRPCSRSVFPVDVVLCLDYSSPPTHPSHVTSSAPLLTIEVPAPPTCCYFFYIVVPVIFNKRVTCKLLPVVSHDTGEMLVHGF